MCMNSCLVKKQGTEFGAIQGRSFPHPQMQLTLKKKKKKRGSGWVDTKIDPSQTKFNSLDKTSRHGL